MIIDTTKLVHKLIKEGKRILVEGANGAALDIDHGTYPFCTSSNTTVGGVCTGLGIPPQLIETSLAVVKAYTTKSGNGPVPSEIIGGLGDVIQKKGGEVGVTTGRKRRCGRLDLDVLKRSVMVNGYSSLMVTKLDILSGLGDLKVLLEDGVYQDLPGWEEDISKVRRFEDLPVNCQKYVRFIEEYVETPVSWIGVGPGREETIKIDK